MNSYQIVKLGDSPGNQASASLGGTCAAWADSLDKARTEVIEVDVATGSVLRRLSFGEAEQIAYDFNHPRIR